MIINDFGNISDWVIVNNNGIVSVSGSDIIYTEVGKLSYTYAIMPMRVYNNNFTIDLTFNVKSMNDSDTKDVIEAGILLCDDSGLNWVYIVYYDSGYSTKPFVNFGHGFFRNGNPTNVNLSAMDLDPVVTRVPLNTNFKISVESSNTEIKIFLNDKLYPTITNNIKISKIGIMNVQNTIILSNFRYYYDSGENLEYSVYSSGYNSIPYKYYEQYIINGYNNPFGNAYLYRKNDNKLIDMVISNEFGLYEFNGVNIKYGYYVLDENNSLIYDTDYEGKETIKGFVEGVVEPLKAILTDKYGNELESQLTIDFEFNNYKLAVLNGNIKVNNQLTPTSYYTNTPQVKGYITGSVNSDCEGTDFKIRCYREDGFFIGDYVIQENGMYEIPNLNVNSSYDILLHDNNASVETMVNSRRIPTKYQ